MRKHQKPKDPRGGHVRLYWEIVDSPAWRLLSHADVRVYVVMRRKLLATNNGNINATLTEMSHAGLKSSSTLAIALQRLEVLGFIEKTRQGGITQGGKMCSLFRFTDEQTFEHAKLGVKASPPTNDWKQIVDMKQARNLLRDLEEKKAKLRFSKRSASAIESEHEICASTIEHEA